MNSDTPHPPLAILARLLGASVIACAAALGACFLVARLAFSGDVTAPVLAGCLISLLGSALAAIPVAFTVNKPPAVFASANLAGIMIRFTVTLALALTLALTGALERAPLLITVGISHLIILGIDVTQLIQLSRRVSGGRA